MHQSYRYRRAFAYAMALSGLVFTSGCGPEKRDEISAATSGYRPSSGSGKSTKDNPSEEGISEGSKQNSKVQSTEATPSKPLPEAPALPEYQPGSSNAELAKKDFMKLSIPKTENPDELIAYIKQNAQSAQRLMEETASGQVTREAALKRAMALGRDMVAAADLLAKFAKTDEHREAAALSKMQALAQMSNMGDIPSGEDLRIVAAKERKSELPVVAEQAAGIQLALCMVDVERGNAKPEMLREQIESFMEINEIGEASFQALTTGIQSLEKVESQSQIELARKLEAKLRDHSNTQLSMAAWSFLAQKSSGFPMLQKVLKDPEAPDADKIGDEAIKAIVKDTDSPWTAAFLVDITTQFEYRGKSEFAASLIKQAEELAKDLPENPLKEQIAKNIASFWKRADILGAEFNFSELSDLQGRPFDFSPYVGKVVIVDIWATWCGPCLRELPNLRSVYDKNKEKGLEIIGINIDEQRTDLEEFLDREKLPWATVVSSDPAKKGFDAPVVENLGISGIPFIAIIGKDGKVAAIHARGPAIEKKVSELLGNE